MTNTIEKITQQDETRSEHIAQIISQLPEKDQEKIYYLVRGIELAGAGQTGTDHAAI